MQPSNCTERKVGSREFVSSIVARLLIRAILALAKRRGPSIVASLFRVQKVKTCTQ